MAEACRGQEFAHCILPGRMQGAWGMHGLGLLHYSYIYISLCGDDACQLSITM